MILHITPPLFKALTNLADKKCRLADGVYMLNTDRINITIGVLDININVLVLAERCSINPQESVQYTQPRIQAKMKYRSIRRSCLKEERQIVWNYRRLFEE